MKTRQLLLALLMFSFGSSIYSQCILTANCPGGNWNNPATWSASGCGTVNVPGSNMTVIIPACSIVTVNINSPTYDNMGIWVSGELNFGVGQKINLSANGWVYVDNGGTLTGGVAGSKITIGGGGNDVWVGPGPDDGPLLFGEGPLPIELSEFSAKANDKQIDLSWTTQSENNNDKFEVERSSDAANFEVIGTVNSKANNGNSSSPLNYSSIDKTPLTSTNYYRIKQIDKNKTFTYSKIISASYSKEKKLRFIIYPNPNNGEFTADIAGLENNHNVSIVMRDDAGALVYNSHFYVQETHDTKLKIVPESKLKPGMYVCSLLLEEIEYKVKVVVN